MAVKTPKLWVYFFWPVVFTAICWAVWLYDFIYVIDYKQGVEPHLPKGLFGIFTSPFLHKDFNHLISNTTPLLVLGSALFFFYKDLPYKVFFWLFIGGGTWLWCLGDVGTNHIGASGMVYGLFAFILVGGIVSKNKNLMAISLLTIFLYGSMIWGIFPIEEHVSWEGHLTSLLWGVILAIFYRKYIPKSAIHPLNDENIKNESLFGPDYWKTDYQISIEQEVIDSENPNDESNNQKVKIYYTYVEKEKKRDLKKLR
jgi:membrane associated rhomboid family serine protease